MPGSFSYVRQQFFGFFFYDKKKGWNRVIQGMCFYSTKKKKLFLHTVCLEIRFFKNNFWPLMVFIFFIGIYNFVQKVLNNSYMNIKVSKMIKVIFYT